MHKTHTYLLIIYIYVGWVIMVNCSSNPVVEELWNLKKQVRRQSAFHPRASATKAHIQISRDEPAGPLVTSYRPGSYFFGVKPIINHADDPSKGITLLFGSRHRIVIEATTGAQQLEIFTVRHNSREVYHCFYNDEPIGEFLNIIIDADRLSFAETPLSTCKKITAASPRPHRYPIEGESPIVRASRLPWYDVVGADASAVVEDEDYEEDDDDDEEEGLFMSPIHRSR